MKNLINQKYIIYMTDKELLNKLQDLFDDRLFYMIKIDENQVNNRAKLNVYKGRLKNTEDDILSLIKK